MQPTPGDHKYRIHDNRNSRYARQVFARTTRNANRIQFTRSNCGTCCYMMHKEEVQNYIEVDSSIFHLLWSEF